MKNKKKIEMFNQIVANDIGETTTQKGYEIKKPRTIRVSDELWKKATKIAHSEGLTTTSIIIKFLKEYVKEHEEIE